MKILDPLKFAELCWPHITFYKEQREIIYSVRDNDETYVPAGNMLGKDFVAAFIALWFFISRHPCRVLTTSVDGTQLQVVLWGEIRRFIQESKHPLPIIANHLHLKKIVNGEECGLSYLLGRVAAKGEGMLGHHIAKTGDGVARTLFMADEASGVDDVSHERADTWADCKLIIGNPYPCTTFFFKGVKGGDVRDKQNPTRFYKKVIHIRGEDSPNVKYGLAEKRMGKKPSNKIIIPGILSYADYVKRRATWDKVRQCIGIDGEFYEGPDSLLYPPQWLNAAEQFAKLGNRGDKKLRTMGVDVAEGGDKTVWTIADPLGIMHQRGEPTPDTNVIPGITIGLMREYEVVPDRVFFDLGGGGKEHVDRLRAMRYPVKGIAFNESPSPPRKRGSSPLQARIEQDETRLVYKNRRAEMYGILRGLITPIQRGEGENLTLESKFGIPRELTELRQQLAPIPFLYDDEGQLFLPPKRKKPGVNSTAVTMTDLIGHSPDEADSAVLAVFGLFHKPVRRKVGAIRL